MAWRKVKILVEHGAEVRVISPELCPELKQMAAKGNIEALAREYKDGDLKSSSGQSVTNPKQAQAIALSEGRRVLKKK